MIVQSFGALRSFSGRPRGLFVGGGSSSHLGLYDHAQTYFQIYKTQPNVRICVDFLARNIAHLGKPVYRRVSDTDRIRLEDHELARWLKNPNPRTSSYRLIEDLMIDVGIYHRGYWAKVRYTSPTGRPAIGLLRIPSDEIRPDDPLYPEEFIWTVNGREKRFPASEIVSFSGYNGGISPLETLRNILAEEAAAAGYREEFWTNGARVEGIWERDKDTKRWTPDQKNEWRKHWQEFSTSAKAGMTAVGDPGMTYKQVTHNAKESEYIAGGKLRREVCAAAYHIPQPMVGILEHATFSNIRAQHEHLYQDTLGPWLEQIQQEIERQLLPECEDQDGIYLEFNIDAKLAGTPIDRATSLQLSVGRPWRTVNEARALDNLPRKDDPSCDEVAPQQGGPAAGAPTNSGDSRTDDADAVVDAIHATRVRYSARLQKVEPVARVDAFMAFYGRFTSELAEDLAWRMPVDDARQRAIHEHGRMLRELKAQADHA
ncbi:COG4695 Phage-related protein [uncultured Caudovirales phage]|uniref:COG4695 Phage-related protein n=1 Tax=uncultured Caudovirales phage TaxID=2100421 RepID=A0A6J5RZG5_9CAUD|nr:COG4695 Phage-related protein [uncultured Caudovirales phage]CAB4199261.1 COG4695 Phage-related protein [uncultured Caudovirales phage]CAB4213010.1 COG4695 Phage-related protein [uncultured Caudovirales phage]CAB5227954.1 COG4695 Phage-related protein [uncultured Caudovirales phage]